MEETRRPKLLLADHSPTIRKVVELTFADEGVDVTSVGDARSAMQKFIEIQPDIVLVDVSLGGTNGYQICEMIKTDEATKHLPVLLLVGSFEPFDQAAAERVGADGFLTKPFQSTRDLVVNVFELLGKEIDSSDVVTANAASEKAIGANGAYAGDAIGKIDNSEPAITEDIDDLYTSSFVQTSEIEEFETVENLFGDSGLDDELIETTYPTEKLETDFQALESVSEYESDTELNAFDWSPKGVVLNDVPILERPASQGFEPKFVFDDLDKDDENFASESQAADIDSTDDNGLSPLNDDGPAEPAKLDRYESADVRNLELNEPSPEFIALVAQRVVERLSDKVIREIAQQAVPRITERLIREALDEENKGSQ